MSEAVSKRVEDGIAILTVNNPPVNALSQAVRQGLKQAMADIAADSTVKAAVVIGAGNGFIAGADVREFGKPPLEPFLPDVIAALEASDKPVVAAIHGVALGGGLEVALGCHYRIADPKARVGFPEVNLGIIPGAGGTQRLPRIVGLEAAIDLITTGRQVGAAEAHKLGIVDEVASGDLLSAAKTFAASKIGKSLPRVSQKPVEMAPSPDFFDAQKAKVARAARGQESPVRAVEAIRAASELPYPEGLKRERAIFQELRDSDQAKALRHVFFAERAVSKVPGLEAKPRTVETIAVIGGGTMGAGIAVAALRSGYKVRMVEADDAAVARGKANVEKNLDGFVSRGRLSADGKAEHLARFSASTDYGSASAADVAIEAVFEDMNVKKDVFRKLDAAMRPGAILATNTSYLDIDEIAAATKRPQDVVGLHFFSPAHIMRLLEIVKPAKTSDDVIATGFEVAKKLGKTGVLSGVCDGFIGNRILAKTRKQADYMIEDGAMPWDVDKAMEAWGMAMGPFRVMDLAGLDISWAQRKRLAATRDPNERYVHVADRLCENGWFGQKTGRGWYVYEDGKPKPNPDVEKIVAEERAKKGITPRTLSADEIQRRILYAMVNEGARILDEGIARRPLDIDMVEIHGYGFPRWRGGPMCQADIIGLPKVLAAVREYARDDALFWKPSPLLEKLVAEGRTFGDLNG
ncbi:MAG: 3-hydroxyacyl-CoA dehydrogenase NAD-binding domain-containing protein [Gemmatimonas sp.]